MQLQTLALVAAEVFGRALPVMLQALLLLAVLLAVCFITTICAPVRSRLLVMLEFASFCVLNLTVTLGLSFTAEEAISPVSAVRQDTGVHAGCKGYDSCKCIATHSHVPD